MPRKPTYGFRAATEDDLPLLAGWLAEPHVREWWGEPDEALAELKDVMEQDSVEPLIVELNGKPIAYLQCYDPHLELSLIHI